MNKLIICLALLSGAFLNAGGAGPQILSSVRVIYINPENQHQSSFVELGQNLNEFHAGVAQAFGLNLDNFGSQAGHLSALALFSDGDQRSSKFIDESNFERFKNQGSNGCDSVNLFLRRFSARRPA